MYWTLALLVAVVLVLPVAAADPPADPFLWLEDVTGEKALAWVKARNAESVAELTKGKEFQDLNARLLKILDSKEKIPFIAKRGELFYNFWRDDTNKRGLWRRTTLAEYRKPEPKWETLLDLDALGEAEKENWVWAGSAWLEPAYDRALVSLSRGGADAVVVREFDPKTKQFVKDGFALPEAKSDIAWKDKDTLYVGTDFGPGSLTDSGYPRVVKEWKRGTKLADAKLVYEGQKTDVAVSASSDHTKGFERDFVVRAVNFYENETFFRRGDKLVKLEKPADAEATAHREWLLIKLRTAWDVGGVKYPGGALIACDFEAFLKGERKFEVLFEPTARKSLASFTATRNHIVLNELDNVRNRLVVLTRAGGKWKRDELPGTPEFATVSADAVDADETDEFFLTVSGYITPSTLALGTIGKEIGRAHV